MLTKLARTIITSNLSMSSLKLKISYAPHKAHNLPWQNKYSSLKNNCHIKPKLFLWIKLLENLHLTIYLISVAETSKLSRQTKACSFWTRTSLKIQSKIFLNIYRVLLFTAGVCFLSTSFSYWYFDKTYSI